METSPQLGLLLLRSRRRANLTQEALAERAGVSVNTISNLEVSRGHLPRRATLDLLVNALATALAPGEQAALQAAFARAVSADRVRQAPRRAASEPTSIALPAGTVTLLCCAIVPTTTHPLDPGKTSAALRLAALLQHHMPRHHGRLLEPPDAADGVVCVFLRAEDALAAARALQQGLADLPICQALHTGWADAGVGEYAGPARRRVARLARLGHAGQVLLSRTTQESVWQRLPEGVRLHGAGSLSLSVVERPQPIARVERPLGVAAEPLRAPPPARTNLVLQLTSFVGRDRDQAVVAALLIQAPLVTLVGAGGCGKTRLALQVAADQLERYSGGVWLVELAALSDPALVPQAVASAVGIRAATDRSLTATLVEALRTASLLLLLDNCEHLLAACAGLASLLLRECPHLHILATSRERLGIGGESSYRVPSLSLPAADEAVSSETLAGYEAIRLFLERARAGAHSFVLTEENAEAVGRICRRLDGIPLAIELAAARVRSLPVEAIASRIDDSLRLLTGGPRDILSRHQTLRATLDWGWDLLNDVEQRLLARLSVFAGGWALQAAGAVCAGDGLADWAVPEVLEALVSKSFVVFDEAGSEVRYALLETVRQYAAERLRTPDERSAVRDQHLAWYLALAEQVERGLGGAEQRQGLMVLEREHDNMRAALGWARRQGDGARGSRLAAALWRFWNMRGYLAEGRGWLESVLTHDTTTIVPPAVRARALNGAGNLADSQGDYAQAAALHEEALALQRMQEDELGIALSLNGLGNVAQKQGEYSKAVALHEEALALRRAARDRSSVAASLSNLAVALSLQGHGTRAVSLLDEALALKRTLGDAWGLAATLNNLGLLLELQGNPRRADALHEEALALRRMLGDTLGVATSLRNLGASAVARRDYARAVPLLEEALASQRVLGDKMGIADALSNLARVAYGRGEYPRATALFVEGLLLSREIGVKDIAADILERLTWVTAARGWALHAALLGGSAERLRADLGIVLLDESRTEHEQALRSMGEALGPEPFAAAWADGRVAPLEQTLGQALHNDDGDVPG